MKTAVLGGSFDPVHLGHLFVADEILSQLGYERVMFVPAGKPPHKPGEPRASGEHRLAMLRIAIADRQQMAVEEYEINRPETSYTINTIRHLQGTGVIGDRPGLIIGEDLVSGFHKWRSADELEEMTDIILVRRPGHTDDEFTRVHTSIDNLLLPISSSEIRRRIIAGEACRYLLPAGVFDYIQANGLYNQV